MSEHSARGSNRSCRDAPGRWVTNNQTKTFSLDRPRLEACGPRVPKFVGLVPRPPLQKPPSRGLERSGGEGGGGDEGLKVEGGFTFGRLQGGLKGVSRGLQGGLKGASRGLEGGFKGPSRGLKGA